MVWITACFSLRAACSTGKLSIIFIDEIAKHHEASTVGSQPSGCSIPCSWGVLLASNTTQDYVQAVKAV